MFKKIKKRYLIIGLAIIIGGIFTFFFYREYAILPLPAYYLMNEIPAPTTSDKVLVISPHPDDEALGAAGFIKRSLEDQASVKVIVVTDGNKHGLREIRKAETISAMKVLGMKESDLIFFNYPDGKLKNFQAAFETNLKKEIDDYQPTIILSTDPADIHPDHAVVGKVVDSIDHQIVDKPALYQYLVHYHRYPRPEGYEPNSFLLPPVKLISNESNWSKLTLTIEEQNDKNEAVLQYKSQLSNKNPILRGLLLSFVRQNELFTIRRY